MKSVVCVRWLTIRNTISLAFTLFFFLDLAPAIAQLAISDSTVNVTFDVFDDKLSIYRPANGIRKNKVDIVNNFQQEYNLRSSHCAGSYCCEGFSYVFFHSNINYPQDELTVWKTILKMTGKLSDSHFLKSGWHGQEGSEYYFMEKYKETKAGELTFLQFIFFDLNGKLAIIFYELSPEFLTKPPFKFSLSSQRQPGKVITGSSNGNTRN